jgi:fluoroacetyl-CoA thioesterase
VGVAGKKLTFKIQAWEAAELIGEAEHDRFIVDEAGFMAKVQAKNRS